MLKFTRHNIIDDAIEYIAGKTADNRPETVRVPLNSLAKAIVEKYRDDERQELLPFISLQKYNKCIKECFREAGLTRTVTIYDSLTGKDKRMELCKYASSHMARRTFVGNLYEQVQDPNLIASMSGHKEGSKVCGRYRHIGEDLKRKTVSLLD
jgi:integrase